MKARAVPGGTAALGVGCNRTGRENRRGDRRGNKKTSEQTRSTHSKVDDECSLGVLGVKNVEPNAACGNGLLTVTAKPHVMLPLLRHICSGAVII